MQENTLITLLLAFHDGLTKMKQLSSQGKGIITNICNLLTQKDILKNSMSTRVISPIQKSLYLYSASQIQKEICEKINIFESQYLVRLLSTKDILRKISQSLYNLSKNLTLDWISQKTPQFRLNLFELTEILFQIYDQYSKQVEFIEKKWKQYCKSLFSGQSIKQDLKFFLLHIIMPSLQLGLDNYWPSKQKIQMILIKLQIYNRIIIMKVRPLIQQVKSNEFEDTTDNHPQENSNYSKTLKINKSKCIVCKKLCNYTCSKCSKHYCGIEHFRSHNLFCSEEFYQKQVIQNLKGLKVKDREQKKKAVQMVKNFQQQLYDMQACPDLTIERLEEILKIIQQGQEPKLTDKQQYRFEQYLQFLNNRDPQKNKLNKCENLPQNNQAKYQAIQVQQPYWEITEGLGVYLTLQPQIQDCVDSQHPQMMIERCSFKQRLQQFKQIHPFNISVVRNQINMHLIQLVYSFVTLYRAFDAECAQFKNILCDAYCSKQNQNLLKTEGISIQLLINEIDIQMIKAEQRIYGKQKQQNILSMWMNQYFQLVQQDLRKVFNNQNLVIETLFRIIDCFNQQYQKIPGEKDVVQKVNQINKSSPSKKQHIKIKKLLKKCQYLLYVAAYNYKQKKLQQLISKVGPLKQQKRKQRKKIQNILNE